MPMFSYESIQQLSSCHPEIKILFNEVIKTFDCIVIQGHRDQAAQEAAFAAGNTKLHWPHGKHNAMPSLAADVAPYPLDWNNQKRMYWFAGYVMGVAQKLKDEGRMTHAVRYGGDWNSNKDITDQTFNDLVHFELVTN
jgi:peptidoglycan L-alanyl-D-glutamate endopeptidase CwlK